MPEIAFMSRLTEADWDATMRGWRCPVLNVPGAVVEGLYVDGDQVDTVKYDVLRQHPNYIDLTFSLRPAEKG